MRIVRLVMLFILFNFTIFIRGHLDAQIFVGRGLVAVNLWFLSEVGDLSFLYRLFCASFEHELYMCFVKGFVISPEVQPMYFNDVCGDLCMLAKWCTC